MIGYVAIDMTMVNFLTLGLSENVFLMSLLSADDLTVYGNLLPLNFEGIHPLYPGFQYGCWCVQCLSFPCNLFEYSLHCRCMTFHKAMPWCESLFSFIIGCVWHSVGLIYNLKTCVPYFGKVLLMLVFRRFFHFCCHWSLILSYYSERPFLQFPWLFFFIFYLFVVFVLFSEWSFIF